MSERARKIFFSEIYGTENEKYWVGTSDGNSRVPMKEHCDALRAAERVIERLLVRVEELEKQIDMRDKNDFTRKIMEGYLFPMNTNERRDYRDRLDRMVAAIEWENYSCEEAVNMAVDQLAAIDAHVAEKFK